MPRSSGLPLGFRVTVRVRVSLISLVSGSSLVGVCRHLSTVVPRYYGWSKKRRDDGTDDGTPVGQYATGHCPVVVNVRRIRRGSGPWRCSSDGIDDETRLIAHRYVVRHHVINLKLSLSTTKYTVT